MAEFPTDEEFGDFMDEVEAQGEAAIATAERDDEKAAKQAQAKKAEREDDAVVSRAEYMTDKFIASASEQEKALFAIYSHGAESPEQVRKAIELARTNAAEASKVTEVTEEVVEELADKKAAQAYGVGPISPGAPARKMTPQEEFDARRQQAKQSSSTRGFYELYRDLPAEAEASRE